VKHRLLVAAGLAATLVGVAGCGGDSGSDKSSATDAKGKTLNVWLMNDAQTGWVKTVDAATAAVKAKYPGLEVKVSYQTWGDHLTKLDASLGGNAVPDVVEFGNTEVVKYAANGALADLSGNKGDFENSDAWLKGLEESGTYDGKLYAVPYYAGSRAVAYNKDQFTAAGITAAPKSYAEFTAANDKLVAKYGSDKQFSAFFMPGQYWYAAMSYVYDQGGSIAKKDGDKWAGNLSSPESIAGLTEWKKLVDKYSRADKRGTEEKQAQVFAQQKAAQALMLGWEAGGVTDPKTGNPKLKDKIGFYALPSVKNDGKAMPVFLGGSDLAVPVKSKNQEFARAWIKEFTGTKAETDFAKAQAIPNTTKLQELTKSDEKFAALAQGVAEGGWFVPNAPGWATVEQQKVLQNFLVAIAQGADIAAEAKKVDDTIASTLNTKV
jgi:N,N'-diacetylchitobiose transport system substrate-binding protein